MLTVEQSGGATRHRRRLVASGLGGALVLVVVLTGARVDVVRDPFLVARASPVAGLAVPPMHEVPVTRIAVAGDTGTGSETQHRTARRMLLQSRERRYDALVLLGDLVYEEGDASLVEHVVLSPFSPLIGAGTVLVPALGNHDYESGEQKKILAALGRPRPWYVHHSGTVRVIVLDSNRVGDAEQLAWLRRTLRDPVLPATWTVAAMHHPAYSAGRHGSDLSVRATWGPLFAAYDVPLVLAGHDHDYQRSTVQAGVTYVVSGAGAKLRPVGRRDFTAVSSSTLHYLDLLFYEDRLVGRAIDHGGRLVDQFTIQRDATRSGAHAALTANKRVVGVERAQVGRSRTPLTPVAPRGRQAAVPRVRVVGAAEAGAGRGGEGGALHLLRYAPPVRSWTGTWTRRSRKASRRCVARSSLTWCAMPHPTPTCRPRNSPSGSCPC